MKLRLPKLKIRNPFTGKVITAGKIIDKALSTVNPLGDVGIFDAIQSKITGGRNNPVAISQPISQPLQQPVVRNLTANNTNNMSNAFNWQNWKYKGANLLQSWGLSPEMSLKVAVLSKIALGFGVVFVAVNYMLPYRKRFF